MEGLGFRFKDLRFRVYISRHEHGSLVQGNPEFYAINSYAQSPDAKLSEPKP